MSLYGAAGALGEDMTEYAIVTNVPADTHVLRCPLCGGLMNAEPLGIRECPHCEFRFVVKQRQPGPMETKGGDNGN